MYTFSFIHQFFQLHFSLFTYFWACSLKYRFWWGAAHLAFQVWLVCGVTCFCRELFLPFAPGYTSPSTFRKWWDFLKQPCAWKEQSTVDRAMDGGTQCINHTFTRWSERQSKCILTKYGLPPRLWMGQFALKGALWHFLICYCGNEKHIRPRHFLCHFLMTLTFGKCPLSGR